MEMDERPKPWRMTDIIIYEKPEFISLGVNTIPEKVVKSGNKKTNVRKSGDSIKCGIQKHITGCLSEIKIECDVSEHQTMTTNDPLYIPEYSSSNPSNLSIAKKTGDKNIKIEHEGSKDVNVSLIVEENLGDPRIKTEPEDHTAVSNNLEIKNDNSVNVEDCVVKEEVVKDTVVKDEFQMNLENYRSEISSLNMTEMCNESIVTSLDSKHRRRSSHLKNDLTGHKAKKQKMVCKCGHKDVEINLPKLPSLEEYILPDVDTADVSHSLMQNEKFVMQNEGIIRTNKGDDICNVCQKYKEKRKLIKSLPDFSEESYNFVNHQRVNKGRKQRKEIQLYNMDTVKSSDKSVKNVQDQKLRRQIISRNQRYRRKDLRKLVNYEVDLTKFFNENDLKNFELGKEKLGLCARPKDIINIPDTSFENEDKDLCTVLKWYRIPSDKLAFHQDQTTHVCEGACNSKRKSARNCPLCPEQFRTLCSVPYDTHILMHTNYKMYQCPKCPKTYSIMLHLHRHLDTHFKLTYECENCNETFNHKCKLFYHQAIHTGHLPFQCKGCGDLFSTNLELTHHRINSTEEPFKCVICNSTFKWYSLLKLHKKQHEMIKPFSCLYCDNKFTWSAHLYSHLEHTHKIDMSYLWNLQEYELNKRDGMYTYL